MTRAVAEQKGIKSCMCVLCRVLGARVKEPQSIFLYLRGAGGRSLPLAGALHGGGLLVLNY